MTARVPQLRVLTARRVLWLATSCALLLSTAPAALARETSPAVRRQEIKRQRAQAAAKLDAAKATDRQIRAALDAVAADVRAQEARSASARQAAAVAAERLRLAKAQAAAVADRLEAVKQTSRRVAVDAYMHGGARRSAASINTADPMMRARSQVLLASAMGTKTDLADSLASSREDLERKRDAAASAAQSASDRKRAATDALSGLKAARDRQTKLADAAEERLERALAEADSLATIDRQLAAELARRQRAYAGRIPSGRASRGGSRQVGNVSLTTVRGITVNSQIAGQLEGLLNAADSAGISLGGSGYRSSEGQVAARRSNCGSSNYDIYEKPASQCSPPTARPGQSMHEQGLAIDFTYGGRVIQSRSNPGYTWLRGNAARFGLYNLPSEAWHWSTNGN